MENDKIAKGMLDLGANINLMTYSLYEELGLGEIKPTNMTVQLADRSVLRPLGIVQDTLVRVDTFLALVDFVVLAPSDKGPSNKDHVILLGRPFMKTLKMQLDVAEGKKAMEIFRDKIIKDMKRPAGKSNTYLVEECNFIS